MLNGLQYPVRSLATMIEGFLVTSRLRNSHFQAMGSPHSYFHRDLNNKAQCTSDIYTFVYDTYIQIDRKLDKIQLD